MEPVLANLIGLAPSERWASGRPPPPGNPETLGLVSTSAGPYTASDFVRPAAVAGGSLKISLTIGNMKHWIACLSLVCLLWSTGCDTVNHSQLQVLVPKGEEKTRATVPASERNSVQQVLKDIATQHHYEDRTKISLIPDTICSYAQPDVKNPISIRAWVDKQRIIIDIVQERPDAAGETLAYTKLREQVMAELEQHFGDRVALVGKTRQAESRSTVAR